MKLDPNNLDPNNFCGSGLRVHPVADLFPLMEGKDFDELCDDIAGRGLQNPIVVCDGVILDGRNRLRACAVNGVELRFAQYAWQPDAEDEWIVSQNIHRRSLSPDQRVAILLKAFDWRGQHHMERLAKVVAAHQTNSKKAGITLQVNSPAASSDKPETTLRVNSPAMPSDPLAGRNKTRARISREAGVSDHKATQAVLVAKNQPELLDAVAAGRTTLREAAHTVRRRTAPSARPGEWNLDRAVRKTCRHIQSAMRACPDQMRRPFLEAVIEAVRKELAE